jgi:hypothetical protein
MTIRPGARETIWALAGAVATAALVLAVLRFHGADDRAAESAARTRRAETVDRMRLGLASAAEAEKSAVLAITDEDSQRFADEARAATTGVEVARSELAEALDAGGTQDERDLFAKFSQQFADLRHVDEELLALAVRNSNLKASALAFGPAAKARDEMTAALTRIAATSATSPDAAKATAPALGAEIAVLRIETLLPPHIAEETDTRMDEMEAAMTKDDAEIRADFDGLAAIPAVAAGADLAAARAAYARFDEVRREVIALSRENTNVRSLSISLHEKRNATALCDETLAALRDAIRAEPVAPEPVRPR